MNVIIQMTIIIIHDPWVDRWHHLYSLCESGVACLLISLCFEVYFSSINNDAHMVCKNWKYIRRPESWCRIIANCSSLFTYSYSIRSSLYWWWIKEDTVFSLLISSTSSTFFRNRVKIIKHDVATTTTNYVTIHLMFPVSVPKGCYYTFWEEEQLHIPFCWSYYCYLSLSLTSFF